MGHQTISCLDFRVASLAGAIGAEDAEFDGAKLEFGERLDHARVRGGGGDFEKKAVMPGSPDQRDG